MKHKSEDYKISAVRFYLSNSFSLLHTCSIFGCSKTSLLRWIHRFLSDNSIRRYNRPSISLKITLPQVKLALSLLDQNQQITMIELKKLVQKQFPSFDITPQHLGSVIRDNNHTRKRTRHHHFPLTRWNVPIDEQKEIDQFFSVVDSYPLDKIISLDETSVSPAMLPEYSRCYLGKRCIVKTNDNFVFQKFTLLVAISNSKCVGWTLYEKGGSTKERIVDFLNQFVFQHYKNHLIILDNARSHYNDYVKNAIIQSGNRYLFSVVYTPRTNAIEPFFNQVKHYLKLNKKVLRFDQLQDEIKNAIGRVKKENYNNYFRYAYKTDEFRVFQRKDSTRKRHLKKYKMA